MKSEQKRNSNRKKIKITSENWLEYTKICGKKLLVLLYPQRCPFCDEVLGREEKKELCCSSCREKLPWVKGPVCMKCGKPVGSAEAEYCPDCQKSHHIFDQGAAVFTYSGCMPGSIYRLKASNRRDYIDFFAAAMKRQSGKYLKRWQPQVILTVPMHPRKRAARGYNQAELLAERFGELTGIPVDQNILCCIRKTKVQKSLGRSARQKNLRGSFVVQKDLGNLRRVLVIDDVYTTGSTMDEIARTLKKAGVEQVYFWVLCTGRGKRGNINISAM